MRKTVALIAVFVAPLLFAPSTLRQQEVGLGFSLGLLMQYIQSGAYLTVLPPDQIEGADEDFNEDYLDEPKEPKSHPENDPRQEQHPEQNDIRFWFYSQDC